MVNDSSPNVIWLSSINVVAHYARSQISVGGGMGTYFPTLPPSDSAPFRLAHLKAKSPFRTHQQPTHGSIQLMVDEDADQHQLINVRCNVDGFTYLGINQSNGP